MYTAHPSKSPKGPKPKRDGRPTFPTLTELMTLDYYIDVDAVSSSDEGDNDGNYDKSILSRWDTRHTFIIFNIWSSLLYYIASNYASSKCALSISIS